jgi:monofunctional biosynthetic peptidoglycan transglycosylase
VRRKILLAASLLLPGFAVYLWAGLPSRADVAALARTNPPETSVMRQRDREAQAAGRKPRRLQKWVPLSRVSRHLIHGVVAAEDPKFFGHEGVDWAAVGDSLEKDIQKGRFARGGSTITQQLAKNLFFTTYKSPIRKLRELIVARWLEHDLTKARILELYLNVIEWGDGVYGCEAAAQRYYDKPAAELTETEAAGLAAMVPSPRRINPRTNAARHARAQKRVLWQMARVGYAKRLASLGATPPPPEPDDTDEGEDENEPDEAPPAAAPSEAPATPAPAETPAP